MSTPRIVGLTITHPMLLWFLALAAIPIIIHLLHRRKFRTVHWAAMDFLLQSDKETARRLRILQLLLLLTRVAILLFIVSALARPLLTGAFFAGMLGQSRSASTLVLDTSCSMALQQGNRTAFETSKEAAQAVASTLRKGDSLSFVTTGPHPSFVTEATRDPAVIHSHIESAKLSHGGTDILGTLAQCLQRMKETAHAHREIILITDCRREGWRIEDTAGWERLNRLLEHCDPKPRLFVVDVSSPGEVDNVFIESVRLPDMPAVADRGYSVECTIRARENGPKAPPVITLYLDNDEREAGRSKGSEFEHGVSTARFLFRPKTPGWHWGKLVIGPDACAPDNVRYFVFEVKESLNVLCLDGSPSSLSFESGMGLLRIALAPDWVGPEETASGEEPSTLRNTTNVIRPTVAPLSRFWDFDLADFPAIFVTDAPGFSERAAATLRSYVSSGGALAIFLGEAVRPNEYASLADPAYGPPLLPARVMEFKGHAVELDDPIAPDVLRLAEFDFTHPVVRPFEDAKDGDLTMPSFYRYAAVEVDEQDPDVRVLVRFDNGDPFLVQRRFGRGVVLLFTSSADLRWSNLPLKPVFLPLMHRVTYWLGARGLNAHDLVAGDEIRYPVASRLADVEIRLERPHGLPAAVRPTLTGTSDETGSRTFPTIVFAGTNEAGIYQAVFPSSASGDAPTVDFAVNADTRESDLTPLPPDALKTLLTATDVEYIRAGQDVAAQIQTSRHGREIWRYLALAVCLLLMTESVLAHEINRQ